MIHNAVLQEHLESKEEEQQQPTSLPRSAELQQTKRPLLRHMRRAQSIAERRFEKQMWFYPPPRCARSLHP